MHIGKMLMLQHGKSEDSEMEDSTERSSSPSAKDSDGNELHQHVLKQIDLHLKWKHPLENTWTLWYLENDRTKAWEEMQNEITSFDMVEDFWSLYNHIKPPSELRVGSDYSLFKKGILPMWEDEANKYGGRWVITVNRNCKYEMDKLWLDLLLVLIGESFEHTNEICGTVINIRGKSNKISIWTANGDNEAAVMEIGTKLCDILVLPPHNLHYQLHKDSMVKQGSLVKAVYSM